jgi:beta-xylosidase
VPDTGDGWYRNPVLYADYSDPDAVRVGDDFFLVSSSFHCTPALPILHSTDLVNWTIVGHAAEGLPSPRYDVPQYGNGVWAPSLRFHDGRFWIYVGDPDLGILMTAAPDPRGPWTPLVLVQEARGWIDPCPLWDDDGRAYLVHAWARSRAGFNSILTVRSMSADGRRIEGERLDVLDGHAAHPTIEGPKFYKRNGYYYIFAPAGGVSRGWQTVLRARSVFGPYEDRIVLAQGHSDVNGPHQGAWVETPSGESWFLHFQDRGPYGRVVHLQPMAWKGDWPVVGEDTDGDGTGEPVERHRKPRVARASAVAVPQTSDDFAAPSLGLQWQWNANSSPGWWSLTAVRGALRLYSVPAPAADARLWAVPNLLMQKLPAPEFTATALVDASRLREDERTGLVVMGLDYAYVGVVRKGAGVRTVRETCLEADAETGEQIEIGPRVTGSRVHLRVRVVEGARCEFSVSFDGTRFETVGGSFETRAHRWVGVRVGLFALAPAGRTATGSVEVNSFRIE